MAPIRRRRPVAALPQRNIKALPKPVARARLMNPAIRENLAAKSMARQTSVTAKPGLSQRWWGPFAIFSGLFNLIESVVFRRQSQRQFKRGPIGAKAGSLLKVKMDMAKSSQRPRYIGRKATLPVGTGKVIGHKVARRGRVQGVFKKAA